VFGDTPNALYGRFTAELTGKALRAADDIASAGLDSGETFQHLTWYTRDPAVSRDGGSIAVPVRVRDDPRGSWCGPPGQSRPTPPARTPRPACWPSTPATCPRCTHFPRPASRSPHSKPHGAWGMICRDSSPTAIVCLSPTMSRCVTVQSAPTSSNGTCARVRSGGSRMAPRCGVRTRRPTDERPSACGAWAASVMSCGWT